MKNHNNYDLEERTLEFSTRVVKHCSKLKQSSMQAIINQLIGSATSVGANYMEANNASSRQDFRNKIYICKKEASESRYWLKLLKKLGDESEERELLENEAQEFVLIFQKITNSLRAGLKSGN